jgi:hypothetical protein
MVRKTRYALMQLDGWRKNLEGGASGVPMGRCPSGRAFGCAGTTPAACFRHSAPIANARRRRLRPSRASPVVVELLAWFGLNRLRQTHEGGMPSRPRRPGSVKRWMYDRRQDRADRIAFHGRSCSASLTMALRRWGVRGPRCCHEKRCPKTLPLRGRPFGANTVLPSLFVKCRC